MLVSWAQPLVNIYYQKNSFVSMGISDAMQCVSHGSYPWVGEALASLLKAGKVYLMLKTGFRFSVNAFNPS
jgi:hypothetical protein